MRDLLLLAVVLGLIPYVLRKPTVGIYVWSWLGYMNPHRMTWSFAYSFPFSQIVAIAALISIIGSKDRRPLPINAVTVLWMFFIGWMCITTLFAMYPEYAWMKLSTVLKIQLVTFLTIIVIRTKQEVDILIWVIFLSIGFFAIKGGVFTIATLGAFRVWGPAGSFIADNNALAVATFMIMPMAWYLSHQTDKQWLRLALYGCMVLCAVSAIGSQSRGALIAAGATSVYLWWKLPGKFISGLLISLVIVGILMFMPDTWYDRMYTIAEYEQDGSAMGRIAAWKLAISVASERLFGAGFDFWGQEAFRTFSSDPTDWGRSVAAHSIYFTMLGEHGWLGLILFFSIFFLGWRMAKAVGRDAALHEDTLWLRDLMSMLQVSLVAYASGGAFLNLGYWDLPWHILAIIQIGRCILNEREAGEAVPTPVRPGFGGRRPGFSSPLGKVPANALPGKGKQFNG